MGSEISWWVKFANVYIKPEYECNVHFQLKHGYQQIATYVSLFRFV